MVTGLSTGIGLETARQLLELGLSNLIHAVRDTRKGEAAQDSFVQSQYRSQNASPSTCEIGIWNLGLAVITFIQQLAGRAMKLDRLDVVILNAGMFKVCVIFHPDTGYEDSI
ncbi:hypothetical protein BJX68DRAFT_270554 [Aspergillus pseudodeflectus]|uniref:Ketoreductase (KR) domain-containing protein n=1 Tax=Aspergillus pseudodeflectus TaxID=176178 RepID=A0ABR4JRH0_9EURO